MPRRRRAKRAKTIVVRITVPKGATSSKACPARRRRRRKGKRKHAARKRTHATHKMPQRTRSGKFKRGKARTVKRKRKGTWGISAKVRKAAALRRAISKQERRVKRTKKILAALARARRAAKKR